MKAIIFFRHGKSDWNSEYEHDHDRPLARRGRKAARKMGRYLAGLDGLPDLIVSSTALRARRTAWLAAKAGDWSVPVEETRDLYDATPDSVLEFIRKLPEDRSAVMLVGHEPVWSACINLLSGSGPVRFPTAAMARIEFDIETWDSLQPGTGSLRWLVVPKALPDQD